MDVARKTINELGIYLNNKKRWFEYMIKHKAFIGRGVGKTFEMKRLLHSEKDDFKVVIDRYNEYREDIQLLSENGYLIAEESCMKPSNNPFLFNYKKL